jgi:Na+-translocating ferredoxin:NAD+ oxidoreductase RNF subunit RnfB
MTNNIIIWDRNKCKTCYSCIRACPVKAIHVKQNTVFPHFEDDRCIHCGHCIAACAYGAIKYYDSKKDVKEMLNSGVKVAAICAPSIAGEFVDIADYRKFVKMIRYLGFYFVNEMSFGVDIIAAKFREITAQNFNGKYFLTSHCPAAVELVEKIYPDLLPNLVPNVSPAAATAIVIRKIHGKNVKVVHITPCVAAKNSLNRYKGNAKIDAVLTFKELRQLFEEFNIKEAYTQISDFDMPFGYKGGLYAIAQGFVEATGLDTSLLNGNTTTVEGSANTIQAVQQFKEFTENIKCNFSLFFCEGCITGPGMSKCDNKFLKQTFTKDYIKKRLANFEIDRWFSDVMTHSRYKELDCQYNNAEYALVKPDEYNVIVALKKITVPKNGIELNCGACGYQTCYGLAYAVAQGIAIPEMCVPNSQFGSREAVINMRRNSEELEKAETRLKELEILYNEAEIESRSNQSALSILIRSLRTGLVLTDPNFKVVDSNIGFVEILGEDAADIHDVIPFLVGANLKSLLPATLISQLTYLLQHDDDKLQRDVEIQGKLINATMFTLIPNQLICIILRNLHSKEERPEEIIERITEVIEENLRQVQQIGFILGEGAAKTEKMMNTIIETYKS